MRGFSDDSPGVDAHHTNKLLLGVIMSNDTPEFREKDFLLFLLDEYEKRYGSSVRFLDSHYFNHHLNREMEAKFPELVTVNGNIKSTKLLDWFKEAESRGIFRKNDNREDYFKFFCTEYGYNKELHAKNPIKWFLKTHWKWFLFITLTVINTFCAVVYGYIQAVK